MLDFEASTNVMTLKVMRQLGLEITRPYGNVFGIDSRDIWVYDLIEDLEVHLARYLEIVIVMDVIVLDVLDTCGILLSRKWVATLGCMVHMDLSYATIPISDEDNIILYNQPENRIHVEYLENDYEFDIPLGGDYSEEPIDCPLDFDPNDLCFSQDKNIIDIIWPRR